MQQPDDRCNLQFLRAGDNLHLCLRSSGYAGDDLLGLFCHLLEGVKVVAEDLQCNISACPCDGLIHTHLHGLGDLVGDAGDPIERLLEIISELLLILCIGVLLLRRETKIRV